MYEIMVEDTFDAAHCLRGYDGSCSRLHGHTYRVAAHFRTLGLGQEGMALDFISAKATLRGIIGHLDHTYINELPEFEVTNATAENLAKYIYDEIKSQVPEAYSVSGWETPTSCATYSED
jgi:6-pyruvoyltetrahydropterin/6-carboxytetrahydropterin synthase